MIVIGFTGVPSDLLAGFLNNSFLAFQLIEAFERRSDVGPYHPAIETFTATASAPYNVECVAGDTIVQGPDGDERIDVLAAHATPFRVWSVTPKGERISATATRAFKKGTAELFEYTLDEGRAIKATHEHRFLTDCGYVHGSEIKVGAQVATVDHGELDQVFDIPPSDVSDADYGSVPATDAVKFRHVVSIRSVGVEDFYDMHVPGWQNYSANGFWNHNTIFAFINKLFDTRGYTSALVKIDLFHGPFALGRDIFKGGLMSLVYRNRTKMYTDYLNNITWRITPDERSLVAQLGDGKRDEAPLAKHQRFITSVYEEINVLTLAPQSG